MTAADDITPSVKTCRVCKSAKPLADFSRNRRRKDGYASECRACKSVLNAKYAEKRRAYQHAYWRAHKAELYAKNRAYRAANLEKINAQERARHKERVETSPEYREMKRSQALRWYRTNRGQVSVKFKSRMRSDPEFREYQRAKGQKWRKKNKDKVRQIVKRSRERHPETARICGDVRRARLRTNGRIDRIDRLAIAIRDNWTCHICKKRIARKDLTLDHLIPVSKGGDHTAKNVAAAHRSCNSSRGAGRLPAQLRLLD